MNRRGFLKLTGSAAAALAATHAIPAGIAIYQEADVALHRKRWIRDMGDYYQLVVPEGKVIRFSVFDKPVLAVIGQGGRIEHCSFNYLNVTNSHQFDVENCIFERGAQAIPDRDCFLRLNGGCSYGRISHCVFGVSPHMDDPSYTYRALVRVSGENSWVDLSHTRVTLV